jgi:hypothetical protein
MTSMTEQPETAPANATAEPKPTTKANVGKRAGHVVSTPAKRGKKAGPSRKRQNGRAKAKVATVKPKAFAGTKTAKILDLLKRPGGATAKELVKTTGWQPHSVRGFLSGNVGKKMGLTVTSVRGEDGERRYSVE